MTHILIVSEPGIDGVFRHVEGLIHYLLESGVKVDFAYSSTRAGPTLIELVHNVKAAGGESIDLATSNAPSIKDLRALIRLRAFVQRRQPNVIHGHSSKAGALVRLLPIQKHIRRYYTPHAYYGMGGNKGLKASVFNVIEQLLGNCGRTIHLSPEESDFAKSTLRLTKAESIIIPNGVDFSLFRPCTSTSERLQIRQELGIVPDDIVIGSIGRLSYQKDPGTLYRAFAHFRRNTKNTDNVKLLHVGNGEVKDTVELTELAEQLEITEHIIRPPYRTDPEVFYRAMDAFCLSSRYEGLPYTGLEALASNLPLILADSPGLKSFGNIQYGFNQVYYGKTECPQSIANAMQQWFKAKHITTEHRALAEQHFSIQVACRQILELYQTE
ncbi:glycosyltransferase [Coraliomargarita algicola]|uniref:Glycosyltransferase n=1 Tax=Coraliomargarita algicola TaxID=3092156 RepID=A0ABZ0RMD1_9BACT|nr:glycosyltransferase [Coraliomargarita sp. J2-16]WPJ97379.1 glycosyltransferase [Coraliomargarita sp. J2-16]